MIPVLLLKTKSSPTDSYEEQFRAATVAADDGGRSFEPYFVPVLQHRLEEAGMNTVRQLLKEQRIGGLATSSYGGMIFTSQRAVEAFAKLVGERDGTLCARLCWRKEGESTI